MGRRNTAGSNPKAYKVNHIRRENRMDLWNEICFLISEHRDSSEVVFQTEVENLFEKLGWSRYKGEIASQVEIPVGSAHKLKPDIIIKRNGEKVFVVELKKPSSGITDRNSQQLVSYMLQLKLKFGILIGDAIQLYYDDPSDSENPIAILSVPFSADNIQGAELIGHLKKSVFEISDFEEYCHGLIAELKEKMDSAALVSYLLSLDGKEFIESVIRKSLEEKYPKGVVRAALQDVCVRRACKLTADEREVECGERAPDVFQTNNQDYRIESNPVLFKDRNVETVRRQTESFQDFVKRTLHYFFNNKMLSSEEIALLKNKDYCKRTFGLEYALLEDNSRNIVDNTGRNRYWTKDIFGDRYYACSQWWKQKMYTYESLFAQWVKHIVDLNILKEGS
jgi:hypothetical protein